MATSKYQTQAIVRNFFEVERWSFDYRLGAEVRIRFEFFFQACLPTQSINGFVFGSLDDPCARRFGNSVAAPLIDGRRERILRGIFGELEIAKLTDQSCNNPAPIRSID